MQFFDTRPHFRVYASFFLYALILGSIYPRLGDIQLKMGVGESALGLALIGAAVGTQVSLAFAQPLVDRLGYRMSMLLSVPLLGFAELLATMAPNPMLFFGALFIGGLAIGIIEMIINLEADRIEHQIGRRIMSRVHAFWSFGFMAAAYVGAFFIGMNVDPTMHLLILFVVVSGLNAILFQGYVPAKPRRAEDNGPSTKFVWPTLPVVLLVMFSLSAMLLEGASLDWSVIYMRDVHGTADWLNAATLGTFALTMAISRFVADSFVDRYGPRSVAQALILTMGVGALFVTFAPHFSFALLGFFLLGIGTSALFPLAVSAAAQMDDRPAAVNVASVVQLAFGAFLIAPPLLGFVAEHYGIRVSYAFGIPFVILSWLTVGRLPTKAESQTESA